MDPQILRSQLRTLIASDVFVPAKKEHITISGTHTKRTDGWLFDFRRVLLKPDVLHIVSQLFSNDFGDDNKIQICGLEVAAIPLVAGIVSHRYRDGIRNNACFIRKSRKKDGLMKMVEGSIEAHIPIILVDDILNSGKSFIRQIEVLEALGHKVHAVWCILRFRDLAYYEYFHKKNIKIFSLFTLDDFSESLHIKNLVHSSPKQPNNPPLVHVWKSVAEGANFAYVVPKSRPCIQKIPENGRIFFGTDSGYFYCSEQATGAVVWKYKVGYHAKGKSIFSSPLLATVHTSDDTVIFGAYDGNVYALDAASGARRWVHFDADWVGSSPCAAPDMGLVFIGTEYGLIRKRGGILAIDIATGRTVWKQHMPAFTHASPTYIPQHRQVVIGSNDGTLRLYDAKKGTLVWEFKTGTPSQHELESGFSAYDIKDGCAYDASLDMIFVGNMDGDFFGIDRASGKCIWQQKAEYGIWGTPCTYKIADTTFICATSLDKHVYCFNAQTGEKKWQRELGARIFTTPFIWRNHHEPTGARDELLVGNNTGRLTALDIESGNELWFITFTERITNAPVYNPHTKRLFVSTFANEIYCLEEKITDSISKTEKN
jgi:outer membrane protein assembly factor BamB/orotate phosphoribosyltransferase